MSESSAEHYCINCGEGIAKEAEICPECGVKQNSEVYERNDEVYCQSCGEAISADAEICPECGIRQELKSSSTVESDTDESDLPATERSPFISLILSLFIPGTGQAYNQEYMKAVVIAVFWIGSWLSATVLIGLILGPAMHFIAAIEAYVSAKNINEKINQQ